MSFSWSEQIKVVEQQESQWTSEKQIHRLTKPGSKYLNLNPYEVGLRSCSGHTKKTGTKKINEEEKKPKNDNEKGGRGATKVKGKRGKMKEERRKVGSSLEENV